MAVDDYAEEDLFKKGAIVEVSSEDSGLRGSWYTATILRSISRKSNKIFIEYHNLTADDEGKKPLREFVKCVLVRPIPPRESNRKFQLSEEVDAYHNDGWWEGVVTEVLADSRYAVFFRCSREQIDFGESELRLHREWVHGDWVPPLEQPPAKNGARADQRKMNGKEKDQRRSNGRAGACPQYLDAHVTDAEDHAHAPSVVLLLLCPVKCIHRRGRAEAWEGRCN
ncbi:hypothetical protein Ancab_020371 [Ancistrocladus abbreviatus]